METTDKESMDMASTLSLVIGVLSLGASAVAGFAWVLVLPVAMGGLLFGLWARGNEGANARRAAIGASLCALAVLVSLVWALVI